MNISDLIRANIKRVRPYSSARLEYSGAKGIYLDANENSLGSVTDIKLNRYPDPLQKEIKKKLARLKNVKEEQIFLGNGSDEAIDLLFRVFCEPKRDSVIIFPPTYGVYAFFAEINDTGLTEIPLINDFQLDVSRILELQDQPPKLLFICSPNNPSANLMHPGDVETILQNVPSLVILDEAYIDFSAEESRLSWLKKYPNLVILQTFSKAWGLASIRMGTAFADPQIIEIMNTIKYPYNISGVSQQMVLKALNGIERKDKMVLKILEQRRFLESRLANMSIVERVYPSDANFILIRVKDAGLVYQVLLKRNIIIRDRSKISGCDNCLRITVGTPAENKKLLAVLKEL